MEEQSIYITINHLDDFECTSFLRPGDRLILKKDRDNIYDDEAIIAYKENKTKVGYVANSVHSVARGTYSAGRLYDRIGDETECIVRFVMAEEEFAIAEIME
ncbi:MAG: DNA-binding protein [Erysipelotrichaceae bacterium]|nr:DNA-binding protein [Erysipelotrichaceae bacterium]